jgi:hypothetical protein
MQLLQLKKRQLLVNDPQIQKELKNRIEEIEDHLGM